VSRYATAIRQHKILLQIIGQIRDLVVPTRHLQVSCADNSAAVLRDQLAALWLGKAVPLLKRDRATARSVRVGAVVLLVMASPQSRSDIICLVCEIARAG